MKHNKRNPRKSSNRGRKREKNNINFTDPIYEFDQQMENLVFGLLGLKDYCNMGVPSGFFDTPEFSDKPTYQKLDERIQGSLNKRLDNDLPF